jgi:hypothetical protein
MSAWRIGKEAADHSTHFVTTGAAGSSRGVGVPHAVSARNEPDLGSPGRVPEGPDESPLQAPPASKTPGQLQTVFDRLTKWIPGDTLAVYAPGVTWLASNNAKPSMFFLAIMMGATPLFVVLAAFSTGRRVTKRVCVAAILGAVAFAIWSMSVPLNGWQSWHLVADHQAGVAIGGTVVGLLFGYIAEGVLERLPADDAV